LGAIETEIPSSKPQPQLHSSSNKEKTHEQPTRQQLTSTMMLDQSYNILFVMLLVFLAVTLPGAAGTKKNRHLSN